jgi:hypothetical protein
VQREDRTKIVILTSSYRIQGEVALAPGARLTDFTVDAKTFLAVANAEVTTHAGREVMRTPFLNVHRDHIEIISPD